MAFADAIPVNRVSRPSAGYHSSSNENGASMRQTRRGGNQSVNISDETMERIAREKLANAGKYRFGYGRSGSFVAKAPAGLKFSAKA